MCTEQGQELEGRDFSSFLRVCMSHVSRDIMTARISLFTVLPVCQRYPLKKEKRKCHAKLERNHVIVFKVKYIFGTQIERKGFKNILKLKDDSKLLL